MKYRQSSDTYIIAVSGGVDSVVLLNMLIVNKLSNYRGAKLIVAHFDHGIREDSRSDRVFVEKLASKYNLPFEYKDGNLGASTSEGAARAARYKFLREVKTKHNAIGIMTAHHQDDVIETIIINILRGTGRKGLSSLTSRDDILRPLLDYSKEQLYSYAKKHRLSWREDPTNTDTAMLRNWVRTSAVPRLSTKQREQLVKTYTHAKTINQEVDVVLRSFYEQTSDSLPRKTVIMLPHSSAKELVALWLRDQGLRSFTSVAIENIVIGAKTLRSGARQDVYGKSYVTYSKDLVTLVKK